MKRCVIELNDVGVSLNGGRDLSPGFALARGKDVLFGKEAFGFCRVHPRQVTDRFWDKLSTDSTGVPAFKEYTYAELAFGHMKQLWEAFGKGANEVVILTPSFYSKTQLGLLLGITNELGMPVRKLVDQGLVGMISRLGLEKVVGYLEVYLHRVVLSIYDVSDTIKLQGFKSYSIEGWSEVLNGLTRNISEEFVNKTRFDPLHRAETEQALFDQVVASLVAFPRKKSTDFSLESGGRNFRVSINSEKLDIWLTPIRSAVNSLIEEANIERCVLSKRALFLGMEEKDGFFMGEEASNEMRYTALWKGRVGGNVVLLTSMPLVRREGKQGNDYHQANRKGWNAAARAGQGQVEMGIDWRECFEHAKRIFEPQELAWLGDVLGKEVCLLGSGDNLAAFALAGMGAKVTSVDFAEEQLSIASRRAAEVNAEISFIRADVTDLSELASDAFDLVYTGGHVACWVSDLGKYYREAVRILKPGGIFIVMEYHPFRRIWKCRDGRLEMDAGYFERGPHEWDRADELTETEAGSLPAYEFNWTVSDFVGAVMDAGVELAKVDEFGEDAECWEKAPLVGLPRRLMIVGRKK